MGDKRLKAVGLGLLKINNFLPKEPVGISHELLGGIDPEVIGQGDGGLGDAGIGDGDLRGDPTPAAKENILELFEALLAGEVNGDLKINRVGFACSRVGQEVDS